ncbi:MAG TPA: hypothetical protein VFH45_13085, partial [Acidimicrobiales bacterium]|nr:hypothetical protein [Acidimicrobiales bacterium]
VVVPSLVADVRRPVAGAAPADAAPDADLVAGLEEPAITAVGGPGLATPVPSEAEPVPAPPGPARAERRRPVAARGGRSS